MIHASSSCSDPSSSESLLSIDYFPSANIARYCPLVAYRLVVELRSRVNPPVLAADGPNQALVGQYHRKELRSKNAFKVFDYLDRLPIKPVATVLRPTLKSRSTPTPVAGIARTSRAIWATVGYSASRIFQHFSGSGCLKMFSRRCLEIAYRF